MNDIWNGFLNDWPTRAEMKRNGEAARAMADDTETPVAGKFYTVTPCFDRGDRSWTDAIWRVLEVCGANAVVEIIRPSETLIRVEPIGSRAWYSVSEETVTAFKEQAQ